MSIARAGLREQRRAFRRFYSGLFLMLGVSLCQQPLSHSTDTYGSTAASLHDQRQPESHATVGLASYYHPSLQGERTSSLCPYDEEALTAAHRTLPLGSLVEVVSDDTGRTVEVTINDRGPYIHGRIIDLSKRAARELGIVRDGVAHVRLRVIQLGDNVRRL